MKKYIFIGLLFLPLFVSPEAVLAIKTGSSDIGFSIKNLSKSSYCLSKEQIDRLKELDLKLMKKKIPLEAEIKVKMLELRYLIDGEKIDEKEINKIIEDISLLRNNILKIQVEYELELNSLLNSEQKKKIKLKNPPCPKIFEF